METGHEDVIEEDSVKSLKEHSYDAILFCLLLGKLKNSSSTVMSHLLSEYLPSASQRYECVKKSLKLLTEDGLLCIITPDSSHQGK